MHCRTVDAWTIRVLGPGAQPTGDTRCTTVAPGRWRQSGGRGAQHRLTSWPPIRARCISPRRLRWRTGHRPSAWCGWSTSSKRCSRSAGDERERRAFSTTCSMPPVSPTAAAWSCSRCAQTSTKCAAYPDLSARIAAQQFLVSPMDGRSLRQAIEEPARHVGLEFEEGLVETILDDVEISPARCRCWSTRCWSCGSGGAGGCSRSKPIARAAALRARLQSEPTPSATRSSRAAGDRAAHHAPLDPTGRRHRRHAAAGNLGRAHHPGRGARGCRTCREDSLAARLLTTNGREVGRRGCAMSRTKR